MDKQDILTQLNNFRDRLHTDVSIAYTNSGRDFGRERFAAWRRQFEKFLDTNFPGMSTRLSANLHKIAFVRGRSESDFDVFMRQDGKPCLAFIDSLKIDVQNGEFEDDPVSVNSSTSMSPYRNGTHDYISGNRVFIGHGRSPMWRELKDFLQDRLQLPWDEFNRAATAGIATTERLIQMLDSACFSFLIMTAEDEHTNSTFHARENVIHEVGLFQGRLGLRRAIILLEDGCSTFSNIHGLTYIEFPRNCISACFEEVRRVLEREQINAPRTPSP